MKLEDTNTPMEHELFLLIQEIKNMISNKHWILQIDEKLEVINEICNSK